MSPALHHANEPASNAARDDINKVEPRSLRTWTPTQAVLAKSAGVFHWTPEGRRLYDYSSGVLVANLGHNPRAWLKRFNGYMGWTADTHMNGSVGDYLPAVAMTTYNAVTPLEVEASRRLKEVVQGQPGGGRLEQVFWAASGSEAIQKALWAAMARDRSREMIIATRNGFHGKKGLANVSALIMRNIRYASNLIQFFKLVFQPHDFVEPLPRDRWTETAADPDDVSGLLLPGAVPTSLRGPAAPPTTPTREPVPA